MPYDVSAKDRDMMIRTVIGEAEDQPPVGQAAVAHVIMNRVKEGYANSPTGVVLSPHQFEPWSTRAQSLMRINPNGGRYLRAARYVDGVLSGEIPDPTGGMTHFLEPNIVQGRYGRLPDWAQGQGLRIGDHQFYSPGHPDVVRNAIASNAPGTAQDAITKAVHGDTAQGDPNAPMAFAETAAAGLRSGDAPEADDKDFFKGLRDEVSKPAATGPDEHADFFSGLRKEVGAQPVGQATGNEAVAERFPEQSMPQGQLTADQTSIEPKAETAGEFINRKVSENQGTGIGDTAARVGYGALKGVQDVSSSIAQGLSWLGVKGAEGLDALTLGKYKGEDVQPFKGLGDAATAWRKRLNDRIDKDNEDFDRLAGLSGQLGRVGGNIAATTIPGAATARAAGFVPKAAEGITGLLQGAARGAAGGATAALGASSASKEDLGTQLLGGALGGAAVGGGAKAARAFEKSLHDSTTTKLLTGLALGGLGVGEYGKDPAQIQADIAKYGALTLLVKAGKHADKILGPLSGAIGTQGMEPIRQGVTVIPNLSGMVR